MKTLLLKFYFFAFFNDFILIYPAYTLMFKDYGLSMSQIGILMVIWSVTGLLLEVPSGILADRLPRKYLLIAATFFKFLAFSSWLGHKFFFYALGFFLWGISGALRSGTFLASAYDELKKINQAHLYEKISGKFKMAANLGIALALSFGGFVSQYSFNLSLILSAAACLITLIISLTFPFATPQKSTQEKYYFRYLFTALKEIKENPDLLKQLIFFTLVLALYGAYDELAPLNVRNLGFNLTQIGLIGAIAYFFISLGFISAPYLDKISSVFNHEVYLLLMAAILYLISAYFYLPFFIVLLIIGSYLIAVFEVKLEAKIQHQIRSQQRATVLSFKALLIGLCNILGIIILSSAAQNFGIRSILVIIGGIWLATAFFYRKNQQENFGGR